MRRILAIDGGGIKGVFPASFLASLESMIGTEIFRYFDLITGTSTGGILALGLALEIPASHLLAFYELHAANIFPDSGFSRTARSIFKAKYDAAPLKTSLMEVFGERRICDCKRRVVIPSFDVNTGDVHIWKTPHHKRLHTDCQCLVVEAAMATTSAPTYLPRFDTELGVPLIDGGVWANNPVMVGVVEAIGLLGWDRADVSVLSLGCTRTPLRTPAADAGKLGWAPFIADLFISAQTRSAIGMAQHLLANREQLVRIDPVVPGVKYGLDRVDELSSLRGLGAAEARRHFPDLCDTILAGPSQNDYRPLYTYRAQSNLLTAEAAAPSQS